MQTLHLPYPISANRYWRVYNNMVVRSREATEFKNTVTVVAARSNIKPTINNVTVALILHPKATLAGLASKCRIDLDNAAKVILDALNGIAYMDDKQIIEYSAKIGEPIQDGGLTISFADADSFITDTDRIDWLADVNNTIGNVMLPTECVHDNIEGGLRAAIDAAIVMGSTQI